MGKISSKDGMLQKIHDLTIHAPLNLSFIIHMVECLSLTAYKASLNIISWILSSNSERG